MGACTSADESVLAQEETSTVPKPFMASSALKDVVLLVDPNVLTVAYISAGWLTHYSVVSVPGSGRRALIIDIMGRVLCIVQCSADQAANTFGVDKTCIASAVIAICIFEGSHHALQCLEEAGTCVLGDDPMLDYVTGFASYLGSMNWFSMGMRNVLTAMDTSAIAAHAKLKYATGEAVKATSLWMNAARLTGLLRSSTA